MLNIILSGCSGKMGRFITEMAQKDPTVRIVEGVDLFPFENAGYPVRTGFDQCCIPADVLIDFSRPSALEGVIAYAKKEHLPVVLATTGYTQEQLEAIDKLAEFVPVFRSGNMSLGINLMLDLLRTSSKILGDDYDIEILEKHHNQKVDAPSGTALMLADAINSVSGNRYHYVFDRHSLDTKRTRDEIGIHSIRGGTIIGEHTVIFAGQDEFFEITHKAQSRQIFAVGALRAARFLQSKPCGMYCMSDIIAKDKTVTQVYSGLDDAVINISDIEPGSRTVSEIFTALAQAEINVDMISQPVPVNGSASLSFSLPYSCLHDAVGILEEIVDRRCMTVYEDVCKLSVEGIGMEHQHGAAADFFAALYENSIPIYLITTSEVKIACCIPKKDAAKAEQILKERFAIDR